MVSTLRLGMFARVFTEAQLVRNSLAKFWS